MENKRDSELREDKRKLLISFWFPGVFVIIMWAIHIINDTYNLDLSRFGLIPLSPKGLIGIVTMPFLHADWQHLLSNSGPLFFLGAGVFYFFTKKAFTIFFLLYFLTGLWLWFFARSGIHIGASGIVYSLASFLFFSGIIKKHKGLLAVSLLIVFVYGSMVWGIFPDFFPDRNISWEGHLMGMVSGLILAVYYKNYGPQKSTFHWDEDEDEDDYENLSQTKNQPSLRVHKDRQKNNGEHQESQFKYFYKKK